MRKLAISILLQAFVSEFIFSWVIVSGLLDFCREATVRKQVLPLLKKEKTQHNIYLNGAIFTGKLASMNIFG
jgi:hypothetical protein